jgi:hypothetical protein
LVLAARLVWVATLVVALAARPVGGSVLVARQALVLLARQVWVAKPVWPLTPGSAARPL